MATTTLYKLVIIATVVLILMTYPSVSHDEREECTGVFDLVFLLESSGSIGSQDFQKLVDFTVNTSDFHIGPDNVQVALAGSRVSSWFGLNKYSNRSDLVKAIRQLNYLAGDRNTSGVLNAARLKLSNGNRTHRLEVYKVIVLVTDGVSSDKNATSENAELLHNEGVIVFALGVGDDVDEDELNVIASQSGNVYHVEDYDKLDDFVNLLRDAICNATRSSYVEDNMQGIFQNADNLESQANDFEPPSNITANSRAGREYRPTSPLAVIVVFSLAVLIL